MARRRKPLDEKGIPYEQPFPGYELNLLLKEDRKCKTWKAWSMLLDREVILKELHPILSERREGVTEEFFGEARSVARLRHPRIVRGLDTGRSGDTFYFVLSVINGPTLAERLERRKEPLTEESVLFLAEQMLEALDYLYELGIVHSNIKPGNILFDEDSMAYLTDLGVPINFLYRTPEGRASAEPTYCAPEQFDPEEYLDSRSDLYSLGLCLYEALTTRRPFACGSTLDMIRCHLEELPLPIRQVLPTCSAATANFIHWLMTRDRDERPADPAEALERLREHPVLASRPKPLPSQAGEKSLPEEEPFPEDHPEETSDLHGEPDPAAETVLPSP